MCIFCKIIDKEIPSETLFEDESYIIINNLHPKAPVHLLIIPKKHIESINDLEDEDGALVGGLFLLARDFAKSKEIPGYKLAFNVGKEGGQEIFHLHLHFMVK